MPTRETRYAVRSPRANRGARRRGRTLLAALALALAACKGTEPETPVGDYALSQIDGKSVPASLFAEPEYQVRVTSGSLAVDAGRTWVAVLSWEETVDGFRSAYVDSVSGTWVEEAGRIVFTDGVDTTFKQNAIWEGASITIKQPGPSGSAMSTAVYAKR